MSKMRIPKIIKNVNMQVYNFLMRSNETRNVLWHESCKCVCRLNSSVCNSKQIWNSNTCRCDGNEVFADILQGSSNLCRLSKAAISDSPYTLLSFHKTFIVLFCRI